MTRAVSVVGGARLRKNKVFVIARVPRVACPEHGVVVAAVPWARHSARHTLAFEQLAAWCAVEMSATAAGNCLRCTWRTVGQIIARVVADLDDDELLEGVTRIGIDEISYRRRIAFSSWWLITIVVGSFMRSTGHASSLDGSSTSSARTEPQLLPTSAPTERPGSSRS